MSRAAIDYEGVQASRLVKGGERFQLTWRKRIWQPRATFGEQWERIDGSQCAYTISPRPDGAQDVAVFDVRVRLSCDKVMTVSDLVEDMERVYWSGPAVVKVKALDTNEALGITEQAAERRQEATQDTQQQVEARKFALLKQLKTGGTFLVVAAVAVVLIVFSPQIKPFLPRVKQ